MFQVDEKEKRLGKTEKHAHFVWGKGESTLFVLSTTANSSDNPCLSCYELALFTAAPPCFLSMWEQQALTVQKPVQTSPPFIFF